MKWYKILLLSILSGLLLGFSWYPHGLPFIIFFAFIPLFFVSDTLLTKKTKIPFLKGLLYSLPAFIVWNTLSTWWIGKCTIPGALGAIAINSILMSFTFGLWHCCKYRGFAKYKVLSAILFVCLWMSFEFIHLNWDLTWPWLNLGNVFAVCPRYVQWYSVTGTFGGTLWVLVCNWLLYAIIIQLKRNKTKVLAYSISAILWLVLPILASLGIYKNVEKNIEKTEPVNIVIVQQNTDPWTEYEKSNRTHIQHILSIAGPSIDSTTDMVICPESSIPGGISLDGLMHHDFSTINENTNGFYLIDSIIGRYPKLNFILGLSTYKAFDYKASATVQQFGPNFYVESYNTATCYNIHHCIGYYHKSRLVPGVEKMPFPRLFGFLGEALIKLGGSNNSLGSDVSQRAFKTTALDNQFKIGTAICYESIYGELFGNFVKNGAQAMTVITNDSWWDDTPGHVQHFEMSRLRAIETRRYVLRAANGGFSGIIDPLGNVLQKTKYNQQTTLKQTIYAQNSTTFYVHHGDYLAKKAIVLSILSILATYLICFVKILRHRKNKSNLARS